MLDYEISASEAAQLLKQNATKIVDVREPWEFSTAHIAGSLLMPMREVPVRARNELDSAERIVVVCHLGVRSMHVTTWLREQGFQGVQSLRGGIDAWSVEVDPGVARY
jgi:rhodanese-related sulfurtransferase